MAARRGTPVTSPGTQSGHIPTPRGNSEEPRSNERKYCAYLNYGELVIADVTGDGLPDVLAALWANAGELDYVRGIALLRNLGNRQFPATATWAVQQPQDWSTTWIDMSLGDLDEDGDLDLAWVDRSERAEVLRNDGYGVFTPWFALDYGYLHSLEFADIDADGHLDFVLSAGLRTWLLAGDGTGNLEHACTLERGLRDLRCASIDGQPGTDLVGLNAQYDTRLFTFIPNATPASSAVDPTIRHGERTLSAFPSVLTQGRCTIRYAPRVPGVFASSAVLARVFDAAGALVTTVPLAGSGANRFEGEWRGTDHSGRPARSGVYWITAGEAQRQRVVVVR